MKKVEFFLDPEMRDGFKVHGASHEEGFVATYPSNKEGAKAEWRLSQWGTYENPFRADSKRVDFEGGGFEYQTESMKATSNPDNKEFDLRLELKTSTEYKGRIRQEGEDWPHLLVEQNDIGVRTPAFGELEKLVLTMDIRLDYCDCKMDPAAFDPEKHSCQVHQYFTIQDDKNEHFMWFGVPYFDTRYDVFPGYIGIDKGKADASGFIIINHPQPEFTDGKAVRGEWTSYQVDLFPRIKKAIEIAHENDLFIGADWNTLKITSMNLGWEMFNEFDGAFSIKNMSLMGYLK